MRLIVKEGYDAEGELQWVMEDWCHPSSGRDTLSIPWMTSYKNSVSEIRTFNESSTSCRRVDMPTNERKLKGNDDLW